MQETFLKQLCKILHGHCFSRVQPGAGLGNLVLDVPNVMLWAAGST